DGIAPHTVRVQEEFNGSSGRLYRIDFAILRPGRQRIAIEIDGYQKTSYESEGGTARLNAASARRNELVNAGWQVLTLPNQQVQTQSGECRRQIENALITGLPPAVTSDWPAISSVSLVDARQNGSTGTEVRGPSRVVKWGVAAATLAVLGVVAFAVANRTSI